MILSAIILFVYAITAVQSGELHEYMSKEEIESVFNVKKDEIHKVEYEVVPIYHKHDNQTNFKVRAFNQNYDVYLEKNNHVLIGQETPIYIAKSNPLTGDSTNSSITYTRILFPLPDNFELYHDVQNKAAFSVHRDTNNMVHLNGMIGANVIVRSVPTRVHQEVLSNFSTIARESSNNPFFSETLRSGEYQTTQHIIMKPAVTGTEYLNRNITRDLSRKVRNKKNRIINDDSDEINNDLIVPLSSRRFNVPNSPRSSKPPNLSDTVYLELLITIDYETFRIHGRNIESIAKYMAAFWNAVDLRYREMNNPKVRLNIAGLIIPQDTNSTPYFEFKHGDSQTISASETLDAIGDYFLSENYFPKNTYDIIVGLTPLVMEHIEKGKQSGYRVTGISNIEAACLVHSGWSDAIVRDKGGFDGITTAAHELAHLMGALHDSEELENPLEGPCPRKNGYLMSRERQTARGMHWSSCSIAAMRYFLRSQHAKCLWNKPHPGKLYPKILPGKLLNRNEQCQRTMGKNADPRYANDCVLLWCDGENKSKPPAEGTSCGNGMICLDAQCVRDPELNS